MSGNVVRSDAGVGQAGLNAGAQEVNRAGAEAAFAGEPVKKGWSIGRILASIFTLGIAAIGFAIYDCIKGAKQAPPPERGRAAQTLGVDAPPPRNVEIPVRLDRTPDQIKSEVAIEWNAGKAATQRHFVDDGALVSVPKDSDDPRGVQLSDAFKRDMLNRSVMQQRGGALTISMSASGARPAAEGKSVPASNLEAYEDFVSDGLGIDKDSPEYAAVSKNMSSLLNQVTYLMPLQKTLADTVGTDRFMAADRDRQTSMTLSPSEDGRSVVFRADVTCRLTDRVSGQPTDNQVNWRREWHIPLDELKKSDFNPAACIAGNATEHGEVVKSEA